jgi:hypothetical protein
MSTGINIKSASYGVGSTNVDVTSEVSSKILDGALNLPVTASALGVDDPAPGQLKTLTIQYSINGGNINSIVEKDGGTAIISAPSERVASGLQITKAEYGYPGNYQDVTDAVQNYLKSDGSVNFKVGFKEVGLPDPNPAKQKQLNVEYTVNGSKNTKTLKDGETWKMSAPPNVSNKKTKATDFVTSVIGSLISGVFRFVGLYIFFLSMYTVVEYGVSFNARFGKNISEILWYAIGLIPFSSLWLLPTINFFLILFYGGSVYASG